MDNKNLTRSFFRCTSFCTADRYNLTKMASFFKKKGYHLRFSKDVLHVANVKKPGDLFFFNHGCFVAWGFKKIFEEKLIEYLREFSVGMLQIIEIDHFYYRYGEETAIDTHEKSRLDIITLENHDPLLKLAISYALAQSIKLESFEEAIKEAVQKNRHLPEEIANHGIISLSRRSIFKRMGEIFLARSSINLNVEYLDAPEFFWRNPSLESYYILVNKFLDIRSRVMALNQKLDVLQELLDILNSQVQHSHSSLLESIIILLIAVEIIISLFQFHVV